MKKMMLLALATSCVVLLLLPVGVFAGVWHVAPNPTVEKPLKFTVAGGQSLWTTPESEGAMIFPCESITGAGAYTSKSTGTLTLAFHKCHPGNKQYCGSLGQPEGTAITTELVFHNITSGNKPAILITTNALTGVLTHSNCPFLETVKGNGIIGTITSPQCGQWSKTATLSFASSPWGIQADRTITFGGTEYSLARSGGGGLSLQAHVTISFSESTTMVCT